MQRASSRPVKTFAIGFPDPKYDETQLRRAGRAAPGDRAPDVHRRAEGVGDAARAGLAVRRAVRRQLGLADVVRRARDPALGDGRADRRRRRRALRRLRPIPGTGADRAVPAAPGRPAAACWAGRWSACCPARRGRRPGSAGSSGCFEHINEPAEARYLGWMTTFDEAARLSLYTDDQLDRLASAASASGRPVGGRPGRAAVRGLRRRRRAATASPAPWSPTS